MSALVVLDPEVAPVWAAQHGIEFTDLEDLATKPEVVEAVNERPGRGRWPSSTTPSGSRRCTILGEEWLPDSDVLTPTSKLKRRGIHARYEIEIESLYS